MTVYNLFTGSGSNLLTLSSIIMKVYQLLQSTKSVSRQSYPQRLLSISHVCRIIAVLGVLYLREMALKYLNR